MKINPYLLYGGAALILTTILRLAIWLLGDLSLPLTILASVNIATWMLVGWDKAISARAEKDKSLARVPELILWLCALLGGSGGLLLGMKFFRHKTKSPSFQLWVVAILAVQALVVLRWGKPLR